MWYYTGQQNVAYDACAEEHKEGFWQGLLSNYEHEPKTQVANNISMDSTTILK